jgi:hypothetical protein
MTRHIEPYRYEVQHSDDADLVAYQRKSRDGVWQTISMWMIPQPAGRRVLASRCTVRGDLGIDRTVSTCVPEPIPFRAGPSGRPSVNRRIADRRKRLQRRQQANCAL